MYKIAKLIFKSILENKEDQKYSLDNLLSMLYKNGQILKDWVVEEYDNYYEVRVITTDDDSLNEKYYNKYIKKKIANFVVSVEILTNDAYADDCCHCDTHSYYVIMNNPDDMSSPIICGDCGREIPLIRIPYLFNEEEHYSILSFQELYKSVDNIWMQGLSDRFSKKQIIDYKSALNKDGLEIRKELESKVNAPVYYLLANPIGGYFEFEKNNKNLEKCPKCEGQFMKLKDSCVDKVCTKCRLAFITHEEDLKKEIGI